MNTHLPKIVLSLTIALTFVAASEPARGQTDDRTNQGKQKETSRNTDQANDASSGLFGDSPVTPVQTHPKGVSYHSPNQVKWKVGVKMATRSNACRNIIITIPVPTPWPEQSVELVDENVPVEVGEVQYRELNCNVKQAVTKVRTLKPKEIFEFDLTFLVTINQIQAPADTTLFQIPKPVPREVKDYLGVSPDISFRNAKLRKQIKEIVRGIESPWQQVESIYDWVRDNIEYREGDKKDSLTTFRDKYGNAEDLVGLFVGMCRAHKVPARMVWTDGHQYAEFYLWDDEKNGHWFPCNVAGIREFGSYSDTRVIMQKGDNVRVPEKEERQKFVAEFATCKGRTKPVVGFLRELLPADK